MPASKTTQLEAVVIEAQRPWFMPAQAVTLHPQWDASSVGGLFLGLALAIVVSLFWLKMTFVSRDRVRASRARSDPRALPAKALKALAAKRELREESEKIDGVLAEHGLLDWLK